MNGTLAGMNPVKKYALFICMAACAAPSFAALLVEETFTYPAGSLYGKSGGSGFSQNWWGGSNGTGAWTVENNAAKISGNNDTWAIRNVSPVSETGFYFSCELGVDTLTGVTGSFRDVVIISVGGGTFSTGVAFNTWGYGIQASIAGQNYNLTASQAIQSTGMTYTIVGHYTFSESTGQATLALWLNPEDGTSGFIHEVSWTATAATVSRITLQRYDNGSRSGIASTTFDNIRIGTEWADVAPTQVPEPGTWAAIAGGLLLGLAVWRRIRSR
ncbi:hypothetical protein OPIT5_08735 [Opitutaceae bacterium TAV5]|nr:hypothetical protein OPIT5_08735 [Opitutaceae bacterium TAV5]